MNKLPMQEIELEDALDNPSEKSLDELMAEQDFDPEEEELYDEDEGFFPSLWDRR